jgi:RISC-loading complex subunit TARBP2
MLCINIEFLLAIGSGRSKKEAKHDAARCMLNRLNAPGITSASDPDTGDVMNVSDITSPYKGMLQENAVGALQELCTTNEIPVPEYMVIGDEGPPHAKRFTIRCQVSKLTESGMFTHSGKNCCYGNTTDKITIPLCCCLHIQGGSNMTGTICV